MPEIWEVTSIVEIISVENLEAMEDEEDDKLVASLETEEDIDNIEEENPENLVSTELRFHVKAASFTSAYTKAAEYLSSQEMIKTFDITGITWRKDIQVVNWEDQDDCDCPFCKAKSCAPDDLMVFACKCGEEIRVADDGWSEIYCPKCNTIISRDRVIEKGGGSGYFLT